MFKLLISIPLFVVLISVILNALLSVMLVLTYSSWRMDAGFIKMEYWANIFGIDSKYTLNRFEGRYENIDDENNNKHVAYQLESHEIIDTLSFLVDTTYGSSTYQDIKLNTKYTVLKSQTGLMVREVEIVKKEEKSYFFGSSSP